MLRWNSIFGGCGRVALIVITHFFMYLVSLEKVKRNGGCKRGEGRKETETIYCVFVVEHSWIELYAFVFIGQLNAMGVRVLVRIIRIRMGRRKTLNDKSRVAILYKPADTGGTRGEQTSWLNKNVAYCMDCKQYIQLTQWNRNKFRRDPPDTSTKINIKFHENREIGSLRTRLILSLRIAHTVPFGCLRSFTSTGRLLSHIRSIINNTTCFLCIFARFLVLSLLFLSSTTSAVRAVVQPKLPFILQALPICECETVSSDWCYLIRRPFSLKYIKSLTGRTCVFEIEH